MSGGSDDYDVAVIEGAVSTEHDIKRLAEIGKRAKIVIALGACATIGGVNGMKNNSTIETVVQRVYPDRAGGVATIPVKTD